MGLLRLDLLLWDKVLLKSMYRIFLCPMCVNIYTFSLGGVQTPQFLHSIPIFNNMSGLVFHTDLDGSMVVPMFLN